MVQIWTPMSEVQRSVNPGEWIMFDGAQKIAVIRELRIGRRRELTYRSVTWAEESEDRILLGYFPHLDFAAEVTWAEWIKATKGIRVPPLLDV